MKNRFFFQVKQYAKMTAQNLVLPMVYRVSCIMSVNPSLVLFADGHHNSRPESMEQVVSRLEEEKRMNPDCPVRIKEMYLDYGRASFGRMLRHMLTFMAWYARAGTVVICDNFLPAASCRKRKGTRVLQLWHACGAFKKFGYDSTDDIPANYRGHVYRNTSLVTVSADACREPFASAMHLPVSRIRALGVPRTDRYFDEKWLQEARDQFFRSRPGAAGKKIALWAPTFRGNAGIPSTIDLDTERLRKELGDDWLVIASVHPHLRKEKAAAGEMATDRLMVCADVLIADYSSLIYEYLLLDKPLVLYVPDREVYRKQRGWYMDIDEIPAEQVVREEALAGAVRGAYEEYRLEENGGQSRRATVKGTGERRRQFLRRYVAACDGKSSERICRWILRPLQK